MSAPAAVPVKMHRALPPEEAARGDFYALLARLLHDAPDAALLANLAAAPALPAEGDAALARAWQMLVDASEAMDPDAAAEEYEVLFVGMGKSVVSIYSGFYSGAPAVDHPRVRIQADLAALGLERREPVHEPEDHLAGLHDAMRVLVAGGAGRSPATLEEQRRFFEAHLAPSVFAFWDSVAEAPQANYYRRVAALGRAFADLEQESFKLESMQVFAEGGSR
jgi:TorA maturation chaperone TorD